MDEDATLCVRSERRYKTCDDQTLECDTFVDFNDPVQGNIIDISPSGLRMLSHGNFKVGQAFITELKTDRLHGVFPGVVRRVEPWTDGNSVLGVQLLEPIPEDILEVLANENVINRRREERVEWQQDAKINWELHDSEVDINIVDCSLGGLKITLKEQIPDGTRLRIHVAAAGDEAETLIPAKTVWQRECDGKWEAGLVFITRELPELISSVMNGNRTTDDAVSVQKKQTMRLGIVVAAVTAVFGFALAQARLFG